MAKSSSLLRSLLVAWRCRLSRASSRPIPEPSSRTRTRRQPPSCRSTSTRPAPASSAFSTSSLTAAAGRSTTSPAAIWLASVSARTWMRGATKAAVPGSGGRGQRWTLPGPANRPGKSRGSREARSERGSLPCPARSAPVHRPVVNARVRLAWIACCVLWGSTWLFIKIGLRDLPPLRFAALRMTLAAAVLVPFAVRAGLLRIGGHASLRVAAVGLIQIGVPYALLFAAQQWVASGLAAVLFATFPIWLLLLARALLPAQPLSPAKLLAAALGIAGVAVLQLPALRAAGAGNRSALGGSLIVAAAVLVALAWTLERGRSATWTPLAAVALGYLAVFGTAVPYLLLFWLLPRVPVAAIGAIPLVDTMLAVCLGSVVLGEPIGWHLLGGGALVLTAAAIANGLGAARLESQPGTP